MEDAEERIEFVGDKAGTFDETEVGEIEVGDNGVSKVLVCVDVVRCFLLRRDVSLSDRSDNDLERRNMMNLRLLERSQPKKYIHRNRSECVAFDTSHHFLRSTTTT